MLHLMQINPLNAKESSKRKTKEQKGHRHMGKKLKQYTQIKNCISTNPKCEWINNPVTRQKLSSWILKTDLTILSIKDAC